MSNVNIQRVIELVNKARKALGLEPVEDLPKGHKTSLTACPIAKALSNGGSAGVAGSFVVLHNGEDEERVAKAWRVKAQVGYVNLPRQVSLFIHDFDNGLLPQYEATEK